jgi:hypothetical protein
MRYCVGYMLSAVSSSELFPHLSTVDRSLIGQFIPKHLCCFMVDLRNILFVRKIIILLKLDDYPFRIYVGWTGKLFFFQFVMPCWYPQTTMFFASLYCIWSSGVVNLSQHGEEFPVPPPVFLAQAFHPVHPPPDRPFQLYIHKFIQLTAPRGTRKFYGTVGYTKLDEFPPEFIRFCSS